MLGLGECLRVGKLVCDFFVKFLLWFFIVLWIIWLELLRFV